jgi:FlaA1/EpsC-like NDP-sugar epimerase
MKIIITGLSKLSRGQKQLLIVVIDSFLAIFGLLSSYALRLGGWIWPEEILFWLIFCSPILLVSILFIFGLYKSITRYTGQRTLFVIFQASTLYAVIWGLTGYMIGFEGTPRSVILINWMLIFLIVSGSRMSARWVFDIDFNKKSKIKNNVLIYGAGSSGRELANALQTSSDYNLVAYLDDDIKIIGSYVNNIRVYASLNPSVLIKKYNIKEVFLSLPSISRKQKNQIIEDFSNLSVLVKSLPSFTQLTRGKIKIDDLLQVNIVELLGRDSVEPDKKLLQVNIYNKVVMVTGAGGSIGTELAKQITLLKPKKLILFDLSEHSLYLVEQSLLNSTKSEIVILPVIGSILSSERVNSVIAHFNVQTIYHAAAYKHVPLVEFNQNEGILNNSIGTMITAQAAINQKVSTFVLISSDKAVRPTNTMGASKRVSELILQALAKEDHSTCFTMVRFGNVLNSSGSVIPLFEKQIRNGGPVTVTDINIVRYFMTIPEAVELVIQAGAIASGGDVFVLDMGKPIRIYDLAVKMIKLSGLQVCDDHNPDGDIKIEYTGLRPGEKLFEELLVGRHATKTINKRIMRAEEEMINWVDLKPILKELEMASIKNDSQKIRSLLADLIPGFKPQFPNVDLLYKK